MVISKKTNIFQDSRGRGVQHFPGGGGGCLTFSRAGGGPIAFSY